MVEQASVQYHGLPPTEEMEWNGLNDSSTGGGAAVAFAVATWLHEALFGRVNARLGRQMIGRSIQHVAFLDSSLFLVNLNR